VAVSFFFAFYQFIVLVPLTNKAAISINAGKVQIMSSLLSGNFADIHGGGFFMSQGSALLRSSVFAMVRAPCVYS
jgi:hypothetical protein